MSKKPWEKPQLIILLRSKPEERILGACKDHQLFPASGLTGQYASCSFTVGGAYSGCAACETTQAS